MSGRGLTSRPEQRFASSTANRRPAEEASSLNENFTKPVKKTIDAFDFFPAQIRVAHRK
jgi:hypothetical protein